MTSNLLEFYKSRDLRSISESAQARLFSEVLEVVESPLDFFEVAVSRPAKTAFARALLGVGFCSKAAPKFRHAKACPACGSREFGLLHYLRDCPRFLSDRSALLAPILERRPSSAVGFFGSNSDTEIARLMLFIRRLEKFFDK